MTDLPASRNRIAGVALAFVSIALLLAVVPALLNFHFILVFLSWVAAIILAIIGIMLAAVGTARGPSRRRRLSAIVLVIGLCIIPSSAAIFVAYSYPIALATD